MRECESAGLGGWIGRLPPEVVGVIEETWQPDAARRRALVGRIADMPDEPIFHLLKQIEWQVRKDPVSLKAVGRELARLEGEKWGALGYPHPGTIFQVPDQDVPVGEFHTGATTGRDAYLHHRAFITRCLERGCCVQDIDDVWLILIHLESRYSSLVLTGIHSANRELGNWTDIQFQYLFRLKYQGRIEEAFDMAERIIYDKTKRRKVFEMYEMIGKKHKRPIRYDLIARAKRPSVGELLAWDGQGGAPAGRTGR